MRQRNFSRTQSREVSQIYESKNIFVNMSMLQKETNHKTYNLAKLVLSSRKVTGGGKAKEPTGIQQYYLDTFEDSVELTGLDGFDTSGMHSSTSFLYA